MACGTHMAQTSRLVRFTGSCRRGDRTNDPVALINIEYEAGVAHAACSDDPYTPQPGQTQAPQDPDIRYTHQACRPIP